MSEFTTNQVAPLGSAQTTETEYRIDGKIVSKEEYELAYATEPVAEEEVPVEEEEETEEEE